MKYFFATSLLIAGYAFGQNWIESAGVPSPGRDDGIAFAIAGTGYLVTGNQGGFSESNDLLLYRPETGEWTEGLAFPGIPRQYASVFVLNDRAYVIGGISESNIPLNDVWRYDPASVQWKQLNDFPGAARWSAFAFATTAHGYFGTGSTLTGLLQDCWQYEPASDRWTQLGDFPGGTRRETVSFSIGEKGFAGLGYAVFGGSDFRSDLYEWNELTNSWTEVPGFPGGGRSYASAAGTNSYGYVGTGQDGTGNFHNDTYRFDPITRSWFPMPGLPVNIRGMSAFAIDDTPYFLTGLTESFQRTSAVYTLENAPVKAGVPFAIYPNPSAGEVVVKAPNGSLVELFLASGKRYAETKAGPQETAWFEQLPAGLYHVRVTTGHETLCGRLVVY
jgi:N-acetylneuraminic acid mutarotase